MSERISDRPHWQRSEGMVIFDAEFRHYFPSVLESVEDTTIESWLRGVHNFYKGRESLISNEALELAWAICVETLRRAPREINKDAILEADGPFRPQPLGTQENFSRFTRWGLHTGLWESTNTMLFFPLNILLVADLKREEQGIKTPIADNLSDIATIMRQPWFHEFCEHASNTGNSVWRMFTSARMSQESYQGFAGYIDITDILQFDFFSTSTGGIGFGFSETALETLKERQRTHNQEASTLPEKKDRDDVIKGMSGGCLARHVEPIFNSSTSDTVTLGRLAAHYDVLAKELLAPRSESAIGFGLNQMAALMERAAIINDRIVA